MIQDSINQMLGSIAIAGRLGKGMIEEKRADKMAQANENLADKIQAAQHKQQEQVAAEANMFGGPPEVGMSVEELELESELEAQSKAAEKTANRPLFANKKDKIRVQQAEREFRENQFQQQKSLNKAYLDRKAKEGSMQRSVGGMDNLTSQIEDLKNLKESVKTSSWDEQLKKMGISPEEWNKEFPRKGGNA